MHGSNINDSVTNLRGSGLDLSLTGNADIKKELEDKLGDEKETDSEDGKYSFQQSFKLAFDQTFDYFYRDICFLF